MEYTPRILEGKIRDMTARFGAILVTGPRQSGKTTLLTHASREIHGEVDAVSFDTPSEIDAFRRDPDLFFANRPGVLLLDEIQNVPDIFPYLKREIDRAGRFRFYISGSQHFDLMKGVTESLAGRTAVLDLWPLSVQEIRRSHPGAALETIRILEDPSRLASLLGSACPLTDHEVVQAMLSGGYPPPALHGSGADWFEGYRRTYVQRDIRQLAQVADLGLFDRFVTLSAGRTATVENVSDMGRILGVDHKTAARWISLLETSYQLVSMPAHASPAKRLVRRPRRFFADIGLALHLQAIRTPDALLNAPHFGSLFESFVVMEIRKTWGHAGLPWDARFFRTPSGLECDLVIPSSGLLVPVEIRHTASPRRRDLTPIESFMTLPDAAPHGILVSMHPRVEALTPRVFNLPLGLLLSGP